MIEKATISDLDKFHDLTKSCGEHLIKNEIFQWNEMYPSKEILKKDIELGQIWKLEKNNILVGIIVLSEIEDVEYANVKWLTQNSKNIYVHRLAVHPNFQGKGFAKKLMDFAEQFAINHDFESVRLDTFSQNGRNQKFYENRDYTKLESIYFPNQSKLPFYCYEKVLNA